MRDNFSVLFWLKLYMIFTKGTYQSAKFQKNFDRSGDISPNLYFGRLLLMKVYKKFWLKKYGGVMSRDTEN